MAGLFIYITSLAAAQWAAAAAANYCTRRY